jgi:hypothetical protein
MQRQQSMLLTIQKSRVRGSQWTSQRGAGPESPHLASIWGARETELIRTLNVGRIGFGGRDPAIAEIAVGPPPHSLAGITQTRRTTALITVRIDAAAMTKKEAWIDVDHLPVDPIRGRDNIMATLKPHPPSSP